MTFFLTLPELAASRDAISHHGYSALVPTMPEWEVVLANWDAIADRISKIDLDTYRPYDLMRFYAPKSRSNLRVVSLLHPQDMLIYTALTIIVKDDIERARISKAKHRVFSYRGVVGDPTKLYDAKGSFADFRKELRKKAENESSKYVALTDVADFFPRIYQHRLKNVITASSTDARGGEVARVLVDKLICNMMHKDSYGIPVGPYSSRILAEAIMIDVDATLMNIKSNFIRWVDDFRIFCKTEEEAQFMLFQLAEFLYSKHGLTLSAAKTKILPIEEFQRRYLRDAEEEVDNSLRSIAEITSQFDPYIAEEVDLSPEEIAELRSINFDQLFREAFAEAKLVDYERLASLLKHPFIFEQLTNEARLDLAELLLQNIRDLYPVAEETARFFYLFGNGTKSDKKKISKGILKLILGKQGHQPPDYFVIWLLSVFCEGSDWGNASELLTVFKTSTSDSVRRFTALAISKVGTRPEAVSIKDDYQAASPLTQSAILFASRKLGADERRHWKLSVQVEGVVEKLI